MHIKIIVVLMIGLALVSVHPAEAPQPKKIPRIGYLSMTFQLLFHPFRGNWLASCASVVLSKSEHRHRVPDIGGKVMVYRPCGGAGSSQR